MPRPWNRLASRRHGENARSMHKELFPNKSTVRVRALLLGGRLELKGLESGRVLPALPLMINAGERGYGGGGRGGAGGRGGGAPGGGGAGRGRRRPRGRGPGGAPGAE